MKRHAGFASILILAAAAAACAAAAGLLVNASWLREAAVHEAARTRLLYEASEASVLRPPLPEAYWESAATAVWFSYIAANPARLSELAGASRDVKRWAAQTRKYARTEAAGALNGPPLDVRDGRAYRKYMKRAGDEKSGVSWCFPEIVDIPDELLASGLRTREDALKVFIMDGRETRRHYPEELLTTESELRRFYSDRFSDRQDIDLLMPFN